MKFRWKWCFHHHEKFQLKWVDENGISFPMRCCGCKLQKIVKGAIVVGWGSKFVDMHDIGGC